MTHTRHLRMATAALVGIALIAALVWALLPAPVLVDLVAARRAPMQVIVSAEGIARIRETWTVTAPVTGNVMRSPVQVGDEVVARETVVALIEPAEPAFLDARARRLAEAAVAEAQAAIHVAEANLVRAETELSHLEAEVERYRKLSERGTLPATTLLDAQQAVASAKALRDAAQADLELKRATQQRMEAQLSGPEVPIVDAPPAQCCTELKAPRSGVVLNVTDLNARLVQAGSPLVTVGDPADLEIRVDLLSSDAVGVVRGTSAFIDRWGGEGVLEAEVRQVEPSAFTRVSALGIEEQRVPLVLDVLTPLEERKGLGDQYRVFVNLVTWEEEDVLQVPQSALFRSAGEWALFVEEEGRAALRQVDVGRMTGEWAQILSGLSAGERVVAYPGSAIETGTRLEPRNPDEGQGQDMEGA
ncbi:HlyD family efflux transporter periplasmic adaptor subunit [Nitratireductor sp. GZWM139]|uniref:efflux RND transporter periplasmic adaptor subunit n=1 Tax=Nitratireductor sp. GZWM139 TaxID=2950541 RepID=UPI0024BE8C94|nr:HlyD family efflux transporter periplasmic adaptor subunit [Nitratireductor sp. GZWM139]MDJ1462341.1 HlyD family efflux transporter periplasmic adaptor subunit [Nitratireductor sp. GZWM139]